MQCRLLTPGLSWARLTVWDGPLRCYRDEFDYLCWTLRRFGVESHDVEDLVHEVFLVLHRKWDSFDSSRPLRPYLFGIAYRVALAHRRRRRELPVDVRGVQDPGMQSDDILEARGTHQLVLAALHQVPEARRAVLIMHDLDEVSMQDVARALRIPLFTAYSRLRKARVEFAAAVANVRRRRTV
jgi:RNA polymerase sigma-70 factor, ECF subfamily